MNYRLNIIFALIYCMTIIAADHYQFPHEENVTLHAILARYQQADNKATALKWYNVLHLMIGIDWPHEEEQEDQCGEWRRNLRHKKMINDLFLSPKNFLDVDTAAQFLIEKINNNQYKFDLSEIGVGEKISSDAEKKVKRLKELGLVGKPQPHHINH